MQQHFFDIDVAQKYGVNCSILLTSIRYWIEKNKANRKHYHDGRYWTYNSVKAFGELFPYLTAKQIRSALEKMEKGGVLLTGVFNKKACDRTKWYSITDYGMSLFDIHVANNDPETIVEDDEDDNENTSKNTDSGQMDSPIQTNSFAPDGKSDLPMQANESASEGEPIPDIYADIYTDNINRSTAPRHNASVKSQSRRIPEKPAIFCEMPCVGTEQTYPVALEYVTEMKSLYPGIDVEKETLKAKAWLISNKSYQKTARGMKRYLNNWYSKAQDASARRMPSGNRDTQQPMFDRLWKKIQAERGK